MENFYLLYGKDKGLIQLELDKLLKKLKVDDVIKYDITSSNLLDVIEDASTVGLFSTKKIIILDDCFFLGANKSVDNIEALEQYIEHYNPDNYCIFLAYMEKIDKAHLENYVQEMKNGGIVVSEAYSEIDIVREINYLKEKLPEDETLRKINLNMEFCGLDLGKIPQQNLGDWTVYIIPILYIISTFISMRITTSMQNKTKKDEEIIDVTENKETERNEMEDAMAQSNKMMSWMMPIMSVSISLVAPLGLALYWLINNILMIGERLILNKIIKD